MTKKKNKLLKATVASAVVTASLPVSAFAATSSFPDVDNNTHTKDIFALVKSGILTGYPDGTFKPKKEVTRGEAATILARALNLESSSDSVVSFTDVAKSSYYYEAVAALVEAKIINGFSDNTFKPDDTLTREQMAKILGIAYNLSSDSSSVFKDVNKSSYAYSYINGLYEAAITLGTTATAFNPTGQVTREQMASFVNRAINYKQEHIISDEVTAVSTNSLQIGDINYQLTEDLLANVSSTLLQSLENATVTVVVKNNKISAFNEIHVNSETDSFDGAGLSLEKLTFKEGVNVLQNVTAEEINVTTASSSIELANIKSNTLNIQKRKTLAASLSIFAAETDFHVEFKEANSIKNVSIDANSLTYVASTQTSIEQLQLTNAKQVNLNSTVGKLQINDTTVISGNGQIKQLEILNKQAKIILSNTVVVGEYLFDGQFYKYDQLQDLGLSVQIGIEENNNNSSSNEGSGNNTGGSSPSNPDQGTGENNGGSSPSNPDQGTGENNGSSPSNPDQGTGGGNGGSSPSNPDQGTDENDGSSPSNPDQGTGENNGSSPSNPDQGTGENNGSSPSNPDQGTGENNGSSPSNPDQGTGENNGSSPSNPDQGNGGGNGGSSPSNPDQGNGGGNGGSSPSNPDQGTGEDNGGSSPSNPDQGTGEDNGGSSPSNPDQGTGEDNGNSSPSNPDPGTGEDNGNSSPSKPDQGTGGETPPDITDGEVALETPANVVTTEGDKVSIEINEVKVEVNNEALATLLKSEQLTNISSMDVIIENNEVVGVKALSFTATINTPAFDANHLQVEQLTISGANNIQNVSVTSALTINTDGAVTLANVQLEPQATVSISGEVTAITGVQDAQSLAVTTSAESLAFNSNENLTADVSIMAVNARTIDNLNTTGVVTVTSGNNDLTLNIQSDTLILEEPKIAAYKFVTVAAFSMMPFAATNQFETKITINNGGGDLVINRKQTILDIQGSSYSTVEVSGDQTQFIGNIPHLLTTSTVGYLTIFGDVTEMTVDGVVTSLVITGGGTIGTLTINNSNPKTIDISGVNVTLTEGQIDAIIPSSTSTTPTLAISIGTTIKLGNYPFLVKIDTNSGQKLKFVQLKSGETLDLNNVPTGTNVETYNGTSLFLNYNTEKIAAFLVDNSGNLISSAIIPTPARNHSRLATIENGNLVFYSAFNNDTNLQDFAKYVYVFSNNKLKDEIPVLTGKAKYDTTKGYATWTAPTSITALEDVLIILDNLVLSASPTEATKVTALKTMAAKAAEGNPMMLYRPIVALLSYKEGTIIDQNLLEIYANRITENPSAYNSLASLSTLVEEVAEEIKYDQDLIPSLSSLLLEDDNVTITSANNAIVTATVANGQILLVPGTDGTTYLTATDGAGNVTKVAVAVNGGKVVQFVPQMIEQTNTMSIVHGDTTKYRTKTDATGKTFIILEDEHTLIVRNSSSTTMDLEKLSFNTLSNSADLKITKTALTAKKATLQELGLTEVKPLENTNIGIIAEGSDVWFYPITTTETNIKLTDGTNTTAVNLKPTATTIDIEIAKTAQALKIADDLGLGNIEKISTAPSTPKIHGQATATELTLFANDAIIASITVEDSNGKKTLLNAQSSVSNGKVTIDAPEIIVHMITESATVHSYPQDLVRIVGNKIYPTGSGTATVTLTDGTIYTIETSLLNGVYSSNVKKQTAFKIDAAALGLNDITEVTANVVNGTATIANKQTLDNNKLIFTMTDSGTAEVTVTATDGSKTLFYVAATKTGDTVTYSAAEIIKKPLNKTELGFTDITGTVDSTKSYARTVHTNDEVTIYGYTVGKQAAEIYNGNAKALVNIETTKDTTTNKLMVTPTVVKTKLTEELHADTTGDSVIRIGTDGTLYAMNEGTTEIQVEETTSGTARYAQLIVSKDSVTGHYSISEPIFIEKHVLSIDDLGLTSIADVTSNTENVKVTKDGEQITISKTNTLTAPARITVTSTSGEITYVHVTADFKAIVEKSNTIDLTTAGLENITATEWLNGTTVRTVTNNTSVTFYSLLTGNASVKMTDSKGLTAIVNISDETATGPKTKKAEIVQASLPDGKTGTLIAGDALRVGNNGNTLFAQKAGTARILADGKVYEYTITESANQYTISEPTVTADVLTIDLKDKLGFTNPNSVKVENEAVATVAVSGDLLTIYKKSSGKTPITVTDATGKTRMFNVDTTDVTPANWLDVTNPVKLGTALTANPTLLHAIEDAGIIKVEENNSNYDVYAQKFGDVEVLYDGKVHRISVKNEQGVAAVSIDEISSAIIKKAELGLANSLEIPDIYNQDDYFITKIGEDLVAYAKTPSSKQELTISDGTANNTIVNLEANADSYTTYSVAKKDNVLTTPGDYGLSAITSFVIKADKPYARYSNNTLYALQAGETYATLSDGTSKALAAISITRNASTNRLTAEIAPIKKSAAELVAGATTISAMPNNGDTTSIVDIRGGVLYATGLGTTLVRVDNYVVEVTVGMNPNTEKFEITAMPMQSATVTANELGLNTITNYSLSANAAQVVQTVQNEDALIFYGKAAGSAQITVTQTDGVTTWNALINVTVAANGDITATPVKYNAAIEAPVTNTATMQNDDARAIWNGTNVELYAVSEGKSSIAFDKGTLNVEVKKDSTTGAYSFVGTPKFESTTIAKANLNVILGEEFAYIEDDGAKTTLVAKKAGKVVLISDDTIYEVTISQDANGHVSIAAPTALPFKSLDINGSYSIAGDAVSSREVDPDNDPATRNKLIVYPTGTNGTSDIHFTSGTNQTTYQVTVINNVFEGASPKLAQTALNTEIANLTTASTKVRVDTTANKLFLNAVGNAYLKGSNGFVNVAVTRDANGYFTATQTAVKDTLSETLVYPAAPSANYRLENKDIYPLTTAADEVLYTATKRVELTTKVENDQIVFSKVEQDMELIPYENYNLVTPTIKENLSPNVAKAEVRADGKLVVYALNEGTTTITVQDSTNNNTLSIYATVDENKNLSTTIAGEAAAIDLAEIGITGTVALKAFEVDTNGTVTLSDYTITKVQPTITDGMIHFSALGTGKTSFAIAEGNTVKAFVNVEVYEDANKRLAARTTIVETTVDISAATVTKLSGPDLFRTYNDKHYATNVGTAVYKTGTGEATIVRIGEVQVDESTKTFSHSASKRHLIELTGATDYNLTAIDSVVIADTTVADGVALDGKAYIYAKNNGVTGVLIGHGANDKAMVQVTNTNGTLTSKVAKENLPTDVAALNTTWTDANGLLQVRDGSIYALATGNTTIKAENGVLANVTVQRDTTLPFKTEITLPKVQPVAGKNVTIISGTDVVHTNGDTVYAKATGKAKIQVNGTIQEVEVKQLANGHYTIEATPAKAQTNLNAAELGLNEITSATITSNILSTDIQDVDVDAAGNELVLFAEQAGTAMLTVTGKSDGETVQTKVQVTVKATNNVLSIDEPIIATHTLTDAANTMISLEPSANYTNESIVRTHDGKLFALTAGETFVQDASGTLYKVKAEQTDALRVAASELAYEFNAEPTIIPPDNGDPVDSVAISGNKVLIKKLDSTVDLDVDGVTYRLTVDADGQISVQSLAQNTVDLSEVFDGTDTISVNAAEVAGFLKVTHTSGETKLTLEPLQTTASEKVIHVTSNGQTVQLLVKVAAEGDGYKATAELISKQFAAADIGFHMDDQEFTILNGIAKVVGGVLKVYPGSVGKHDFIVKHTVDGTVLRKAIMRLDVTGLNQFTVGKLTHTVTDATFTDATKVIAQQGTALATGGTNITVTNFDGSPTLFIVNGTDGYRQFKVSTSADLNAAYTYDIVQTTVQRPYTVIGDVTNVNGTFFTAKDGSNTIIFSTGTHDGSAIINGVMHNLVADDSANNLVTATPVLSALTGDYTFVSGINNILKQDDNKWVATAVGTGYYKNADGYYKVTVAADATNVNHFKVNVDQVAHQALDAVYGNITLLKHPEGVFVDGNTIYGETDGSNIVVSAYDGESRVLLTGTTLGADPAPNPDTNLKPLKLNVLTELDWSNVDSWIINSGNNVARIEKNDTGTELYIQNFGEFKATFTAASGVTKTLEFKIDENYILSATTVGQNTIRYDVANEGFSNSGGEFASSFEVTFDLNYNLADFSLEIDPSNFQGDVITLNNQLIITAYAIDLKGNFFINTKETSTITSTIDGEFINNSWNVFITDNNVVPSNKVLFIKNN